MKRSILHWLPAIFWAGIIFFLSSRSDLAQPLDPLESILVRKGSHFLEYALLAWLLLRGFQAGRGKAPAGYLCALALAILYAMSDEFRQSFTPLRNPSPGDVGIDTLGAAVALAAARVTERRSRT